jgi:DNA-directed RNA polymerase II subunit RPB1
MNKTNSGIGTKREPSKIIGIQFSILSPDEIRKNSVAQITSRDTYIGSKPIIGGLFDPRMGVLEPGLVCPTDGLTYMQTPGYFGHLELARPVYYIQYLSTVLKIARCICYKCSKLLICKEKHKNLLNLHSKVRWDEVFTLANKVKRCGEENEDGCGYKQPSKIRKEGIATILATWENLAAGEDENNKMILRLTPELMLDKFKRISDDDINFMGFSSIWSRPEWMICQVLAVPPPAVRPSIKLDAQQRSEDDISNILVNIIKTNKGLEEKLKQNVAENIIDDWTMLLQFYVATMINNKLPGVDGPRIRTGRALKSIQERLGSKGGRVRGNLMGKRVDFSARSVITPDPNIGIRELGVPLKIATNITYPAKVNSRNKQFLITLILNGPHKYPGAKILETKYGQQISLKTIDRESIELSEGDIVHRHMLDGDIVLFNRQPTLHRMSMMAHVVRIMYKGDTFRMNVGDTKPYNADFDGDEMNMHMPQDEEAAMELRQLAAVQNQIISPANNASIIGIFQDSLLGAFRFTRNNNYFTPLQSMNLLMSYNFTNPEIFNFDKNNITNNISSFQILSQILPPITAIFPNNKLSDDEDKKISNNIIEIINGEYKRGQIDKSVLGGGSKGLIQRIFNAYSANSSADFIDDLQNIITEYMKSSAFSVGISDLIANIETNDKISSAITNKKQKVNNLINQIKIGVFENNTGKSNVQEFESQVNIILNKAQEEAGKIGRNSLDKDNRFVILVTSGSKGSTLNIAQMISCLGQQNVDGKRIPYGYNNRTLPHYTKYDDSPEARGFVEDSFIQGLTPQELFFHAMGGRIGLIDTAVKTSQTGYIQRRLIKGMEDIYVAYDMTCRNNMGKIIQYKYGDDGFDTTKVESQSLQLVNMTIEDIYTYNQIPSSKNKIFKTIFTNETFKKISKQSKDLDMRIKTEIDNMILARNEIISKIFKFTNENKIFIPIHFNNIINNVKNQLHLQQTSLVDITPLECYELLDNYLNKMNNFHYNEPCKLFKYVFYYYLSPNKLLIDYRFNKNSIIYLLELIVTYYKKSVVNPGEMVGMIGAQSIGEPTTQMTLNTFHFAGVASKSNVTRGVPRIEECLSLTENLKNPSLTIHLKPAEETDKNKAQELKHNLEFTKLKDITKSVTICFDPEDNNTLIEEDKPLISQYYEFMKMIENNDDDEDKIVCNNNDEKSKWIMRFEFDAEEMLDRNISMDDIHFSLENGYKDEISCLYSDYNSDKLIFRIRLNDNPRKKKSDTETLDQMDEIYMLQNIQNHFLNNIVIKGIKSLSKVNLRKIQNNLIEEDGNFIPKESWVLDTIGTNLLDILAVDTIDYTRTISNDIMETYKVLGIEAARQTILNEILEVIQFDGTYINYHHVAMLADRMTTNKKLVSIFRHGINNDEIGPIAKACFEETPEMFIRAAKHAELDNMRGVSANVMCGQEGYFGTSCFQVLLNLNEIISLSAKNINFDKSFEEISEPSLNIIEKQIDYHEKMCNKIRANTLKYETETPTVFEQYQEDKAEHDFTKNNFNKDKWLKKCNK